MIGRVPKSFRRLSDLTPGVQPPAEANEKFRLKGSGNFSLSWAY